VSTACSEITAGVLEVDGVDVAFSDTGGAGTPIVLLHSAGGNAAVDFFHLSPMLAARHRVIGLDLTVPSDDQGPTVGRLCRQVLAVIDACSANRPVDVVGYSLGAVVAAALAADHSTRIAHLILVAGWVKTTRHQRALTASCRAVSGAEPGARDELTLVTQFSPAYLAARTQAELETLGAARPVPEPELTRRWIVADEVDLSETVVRVSTPTLVIGCTRDLVAPREHAESLFGAIEDSRLAFVDSGHAVLTERPAEVFGLVDAFVSGRMTVPAGTVIPTTDV
jgi:pimeloyl-ACP methyl ester carboxylesterase